VLSGSSLVYDLWITPTDRQLLLSSAVERHIVRWLVNSDVEIKVRRCFDAQRYEEALALLQAEISRSKDADWYCLYLAGQASRHLNRFKDAEEYLRSASQSPGGNHAAVFLALGIALQLQEKYGEACVAFLDGLALERDNDSILNSLAMTYRKMNRFEEALTTYEKALIGFFRRLAMSLNNSPNNPIVQHRNTQGQLWVSKAAEMAMFIAATIEGTSTVAFPTPESAEIEARTQSHKGLLWSVGQKDGKKTVVFLPNFFDTLRQQLRATPMYAVLLNNLGGVLAALQRKDDAQKCFLESIEFTPNGCEYPAPKYGLARL
jgi:tetratricopeptide (TPR) repeat protein